MTCVYIQKSKKDIIAAHSTSFSSLAQKHTIPPPLAPTRRPNSPTLRHDPSQESGLLPEQCAADGGQELQRRSACTRGSAPPRWVAAAERREPHGAHAWPVRDSRLCGPMAAKRHALGWRGLRTSAGPAAAEQQARTKPVGAPHLRGGRRHWSDELRASQAASKTRRH